MTKNGKIALLAVLALLQAAVTFSQQDSLNRVSHMKDSLSRVSFVKDSLNKRYRIAVFAPLYLDSAFDAVGNYRYAKTFPKFINPGLEFWEGAQLAVDSLQKEKLKVDLYVYDTKSATKKFPQVLTEEMIKTIDLFIGHVNVNEASALAQTAAGLNVPFINVNLPNEAGVTNNPNYVILNSTLMTHCTGIYKFLQKNYSVSNIIVFRKKGTQEDRLKEYFTQVEKTTASIPLKMKYVMLENNFTIKQLLPYIDSNRTNVCLAGSLDALFGQNLCQQLSSVSESYSSTVIGMPTWDVLDFEKPFYKGIEIIYSTPFYINPLDKLADTVNNHFKTAFYSRPSDMVFRGYETIYHFAHLLVLHDKNLSSSLSDKRFKLFSEFDIQPVLDKQTMTLEYFENKKLYFVKKVDGVVKAVY